ncbi:DUF2533 family protein [Metabacillus litoralis]|jgi:hypothetical protein|uniref:DUF2533 family protein n=1 Tax=Metabacillus litoralis TaxID=152268 RepID=UPI00203C14DB|nr:DUF2533 family protein [Metabacillus litoralis]MCM3652048.1 YpbS family protein [Metabacillus litoralis]
MSNVHDAITKHSKNQHNHIQSFLKLEAMRESLIDEAIQLCVSSLPFEVDKINQVTGEMNRLASEGIVPTRKMVTKQMVQDFVQKKSGK